MAAASLIGEVHVFVQLIMSCRSCEGGAAGRRTNDRVPCLLLKWQERTCASWLYNVGEDIQIRHRFIRRHDNYDEVRGQRKRPSEKAREEHKFRKFKEHLYMKRKNEAAVGASVAQRKTARFRRARSGLRGEKIGQAQWGPRSNGRADDGAGGKEREGGRDI